MERFGRRFNIQVATVVFIVGAVIQTAASHNLSYMYAGRAITGLAVGAITACTPSYIAEISPPAIRGQLTGYFEIVRHLLAYHPYLILTNR